MLISVIVSVYNAEDYIGECAKSVLSQTYRNIELLLIDDGSCDDSGKIIDEIALSDERVRVFHKENGGTHTARNLGLANANGEYVMFMDPDDWFDTCTIGQLVEKIRQYDLDAIRFNYVREFEDKSLKKENTFLKESVYRNEECKEILRQTVGLTGEELRHPENLNFLASVCFMSYRKKIIDDNGLQFFNIREIGTFSDGLFNIEFLKHVKSFLFVDKPFYHYRKTNSQSATSNYRENFLQKQNLLLSKVHDIVITVGDEQVNKAYCNRIAIGTMELLLNALKKKGYFFERYEEVKQILRDDLHKKAVSELNVSLLPFKWKIYFSFIKLQIVPLVYVMTYAIKILMKRGK